jgi:hypothetical protein
MLEITVMVANVFIACNILNNCLRHYNCVPSDLVSYSQDKNGKLSSPIKGLALDAAQIALVHNYFLVK